MLTKNFTNRTKKQTGQTLIETLVAAFILTMGISAALGLATYSLKATTGIKERIIAIGLAREGIEAVKNMRDTNWLQGTLSTNCYDFQNTGTPDMSCYQNWLKPGTPKSYDLSAGGTYYLSFDTTTPNYWQLVSNNSAPYYFGLNYVKGDPTKGFYEVPLGGVSVTNGTSGFGRAITITQDNSFYPFNQGTTGPRLTITSQVWWHDNTNCPVSDSIPTNSTCMITLKTYLTNWKTF